MYLYLGFFLTIVTLSARSAAQSCTGNLVQGADFEGNSFTGYWSHSLGATIRQTSGSYDQVVQLIPDSAGDDYFQQHITALSSCPTGTLTFNFAFDILFNGVPADPSIIKVCFGSSPFDPMSNPNSMCQSLAGFSCYGDDDGWAHIDGQISLTSVSAVWYSFYVPLSGLTETPTSDPSGPNVLIDNVYLGLAPPTLPATCKFI